MAGPELEALQALEAKLRQSAKSPRRPAGPLAPADQPVRESNNKPTQCWVTLW